MKDTTKELITLNSRLLSFLVQPLEYGWSAELIRDTYNQYIEEVKKLNIDFNNLTDLDIELLGLGKTEINNIYAVPLHMLRVIPDNVDLYNIFNGEKILNRQNLDNDTRCGYLAYGIKVK